MWPIHVHGAECGWEGDGWDVPAREKARVAISNAAHVALTVFFRGFLI